MKPSLFVSLFAGLLAMGNDSVQGQVDLDHVTTLSLSEVEEAIGDPDWILVDARTSDAYNGWKLGDVRRGGHLPGAVDFPAAWLESSHPDRDRILEKARREKGIVPEKSIVIYGPDARERRLLAAYLTQAGFRRLFEFDLGDWANEQSKPLEQYEHYELLVPPVIVKQLLDGQRPESFEEAKRVKFVEASWGEEAASYSKGHVPQSFHVNTDHFEPPPSWRLGNAEVLRRFVERYGFQLDDTVVISGADPTAAYRLAVVLRYIGLDDVRVLNGGFNAWKTAGFAIEYESTLPPQGPAFKGEIPGRPDLIDSTSSVRKSLESSDSFALIDTRTWAEYVGETSGYKYHLRKGRIPGGLYGQSNHRGENSLTPYRNIDDTMRNADEIRSLWRQSGIVFDQHLSFFCGGGWRAAEVLTFAQVMGLEDTSLYSDGWIGWSSDPDNPIDTGKPQ